MKKSRLLLAGAIVALVFTACKKEECSECHYDKNGAEIELGEKCGAELENLEASGYTVNDTLYTVHCHGH
jgi:hypothetical protein